MEARVVKLVEQATGSLKKAVTYDKAKKFNDALPKYQEGVAFLMDALNLLTEADTRKAVFRTKIDEYIRRAEELRDIVKPEVKSIEQRIVQDNSVGHGYDRVFAKCLDDSLTSVVVKDAYIIAHHQIVNFVRFCELVVQSARNIRYISLSTGENARQNAAAFEELRGSLEKNKIALSVGFSTVLHDREIIFDNGWVVKNWPRTRLFQTFWEILSRLHYKLVHSFFCGGKNKSKSIGSKMTRRSNYIESPELTKYKDGLFEEAEKLVKEEFPRKVIEFNGLLKQSRFSMERLTEILPEPSMNIPIPKVENGKVSLPDEPPRKRVKQEDESDVVDGKQLVVNDPGDMVFNKFTSPFQTKCAPVYAFINGSVPCNDHLAHLMDEVRPLLRTAVENVNTVKMWITLMIPRIEDGNNFGVGIQEEALSEVRTVENEVASFLDQMGRYFTSRAKLITKIAKYPHVDDYRRAILDMDEKQFINIRLIILEMRNHFSTLHDVIMKNYEKIKKPRTTNTEHLY
ncbi:unnamed protein product [Caenorhabditis auriculariae]|uniref:MIT domain-containing protein n=1 Tax=Caenorhabditis auriculariae TaxID=2777116 RepID=A0A8S1HT65_9PELO|nr:unnamed protein product [Caenorhabditis auriculariae]